MITKLSEDPVLLLLFIGLFISTGLMIGCAVWLKEDAQTFQVISTTLVGGFAGSFFTRLQTTKKSSTPDDQK